MQKDKQISWQGIFKGLCELYAGGKADYMEISKMATELNEGLYIQYPDNEQPVRTAHPVQRSQAEKLCPAPACGKPMVRQYNKKNAKAPDWKCSDKNCKFTRTMSGAWKPSDFITGCWDEKPEERSKFIKDMGEMPVIDMLEEAAFNQRRIDEDGFISQ